MKSLFCGCRKDDHCEEEEEEKSSKISFQFVTSGVHFTNVLRAAFTHVDPECAKKDSQVRSVIWHFCSLRALKLHVKCW